MPSGVSFMLLGVDSSDRRGRVETNLLRAPVWDAASRMQPEKPASGHLTARSLLGADKRVLISRRLAMRDLAVLAHITQQLPAAGDEWAATTLHEMGVAVYGREPGGHDRQALHESLDRLWDVTITMPGFDAADGHQLVDEIGGRRSRLIQQIDIERARKLRLQLVAAKDDEQAKHAASRDLGKLRGTDHVHIELANWYVGQVRAGGWTGLDLEMFRALGVGLAARVWSYIEAERYEPKTPELEATYIGLGTPALAALDLAGYARPRAARAKLVTAGQRIVATDARYQRAEVRRGRHGWELLVARLRGGQELEERRRIRTTSRAAGLTPS